MIILNVTAISKWGENPTAPEHNRTWIKPMLFIGRHIIMDFPAIVTYEFFDFEEQEFISLKELHPLHPEDKLLGEYFVSMHPITPASETK